MKLRKAYLPGGEVREFEEGSSIFEILNCKKEITEPFVAIVDGSEIEDLSKKIYYDVKIKPLGVNSNTGEKAYLRTLTFVLIKAVNNVYPEAKVVVKNTFSRGLYGKIENIDEITEEKIENIKLNMQELIDNDLSIEKIKVRRSEAQKIFSEQNMEDKLKGLEYVDLPYLSLYKCEEFFDYFYGTMLISTGYLKVYDLLKNDDGFILMAPTKDSNFKLLEFRDSPKLAEVFDETEKVAQIVDVADVGSLNNKVQSGNLNDIVLVSESFHEKKIGNIADKIFEKKDKIKLITIAGPSASGKATFSKRLAIQLRVLGFKPYTISIANYSKDKRYIPRGENGEYEFDNIEATDIELLNNHLQMLLNGEEVNMPIFDLASGNRSLETKIFKMETNTILILEGIHGLNERLTECIPKENKFKIYVSALTQLSIDNHNTMEPKDVRILRRVIRDNRILGIGADVTINNRPHVDEVEDKSVFPFQEEADVMFNSTVIYEMSVLKKYAEPLLESVHKENPAYLEAKRLLDSISYFNEAEETIIPINSIIKEFIGGSCFE